MPKETLAIIWDSFSSPYGAIKDTTLKETKNNGIHTKATFTITPENRIYDLYLNLDKQGKIDDFSTTMNYPPGQLLNLEYNNPDNYNEKQVVIGEGTFSLQGVLTVPKGEGD